MSRLRPSVRKMLSSSLILLAGVSLSVAAAFGPDLYRQYCTARRTTCRSSLKNLGLAIRQYQETDREAESRMTFHLQ